MEDRLLSYSTGRTTIDDSAALVFGELVKLTHPVLQGFRSDLYHDAMWLSERLKGDDVTFFYAFDDSGTQICSTEGDLHRGHQYRIRVWCDGGATRMSVAGA